MDVACGRPGPGIPVRLDCREADGGWRPAGAGITNEDGRVDDLLDVPIRVGVYRMTFDTARYLLEAHGTAFYPEVVVIFEVVEAQEHHHVPLLLSPYSYVTYRGS